MNLEALIRQEIAAQGAIPFSRFMELALYAPGLGYYSAGYPKFGKAGDFVTAPEISPLFSKCWANQCEEVLAEIPDGNILEIGAGSGVMALDILKTLQEKGCLPSEYLILEVSADLRDRQRKLFVEGGPEFLAKVRWLETWPVDFSGVVLANEVLDAMPVTLFEWEKGEFKEIFVGWEQGQFVEVKKPASFVLPFLVEADKYRSEVNFLLPGWMKGLSSSLKKGLVLLCDYGFPRHAYYHPERRLGTLMCHVRHRVHTNPLTEVGKQDITSHVDFTWVAECAAEAGFQVAGFCTQAAFLLSCGLLEYAQIHKDLHARLALNQQIHLLTSPAEMGELFKVMALAKGLEAKPWCGFRMQDHRTRL